MDGPLTTNTVNQPFMTIGTRLSWEAGKQAALEVKASAQPRLAGDGASLAESSAPKAKKSKRASRTKATRRA